MFLLKSNPTTSDSTSQAAPFGLYITGAKETTYGSKIPVVRSQEQVLTTILDKDTATITDSIVEFDAGDYANNIILVSVGSSIYSLASDRNNLEPGEYSFDFATKILKVYLKEGDSLDNASLVYKTGFDVNSFTAALAGLGSITQGQAINFTLNKSNEICLGKDAFFHKWNVFGNFSISDRFGEETDSINLSFQSCKNQENSIRAELYNGKEVATLGRKWVVSNLQIFDQFYSDAITVEITLSHPLASRGIPSHSKADKLLKLKKKTGSNSYARTRNLSEFANLAGVNYQGQDVGIRIPRSTSYSATTTVRSLVESRAITKHGFTFYNKEGGIEIRTWDNRRVHIINESDLRSKQVAFNYSGQGSWLNGVQLASELRNRKIELDFDEDAQPKNQGITQEWIFTNCDDLFELYRPTYESDGQLRIPTAEILRSPLVNFDSNGTFNKQADKVTYFNSTPTFTESIHTGFAYSTADGIADDGTGSGVYRVNITPQGGVIIELDTTASPDAYFDVYRQTTTDWVFNSEDGYLEEIRITGTEKSRVRQETENLEAITLLAQAIANGTDVNGTFTLDPSLKAQADAYKFSKNLDVINTTIYASELFEDHYDDVVQSEDCEDPDFIKPKFMRSMKRSQDNSFVAENPKNTEDFTYPPIESGVKHRETEIVSLKSTDFPQKYEIHRKNQKIEGENFKNARAEGNKDYRDGKPSPHTRLDLTFDPDNTQLNNNTNYETYRNQNYYLYSSGVIDLATKTNEGTIGYPDIDDPNIVKAIAETEQSIQNSRNSCTTQIDIHWRNGVEVGDKALFRGQLWRIFGIDDARSISNIGQQKSDRFVLDLGLDLKVTLNMENRRCEFGSVTRPTLT